MLYLAGPSVHVRPEDRECPKWFPWLVAADKLHTQPWVLQGHPLVPDRYVAEYWMDKALAWGSAEAEAWEKRQKDPNAYEFAGGGAKYDTSGYTFVN